MSLKDVSQLRGVSLDWAVAKALDEPITIERSTAGNPILTDTRNRHFTPSRTWGQGGPIIQSECIHLSEFEGVWSGIKWDEDADIQHEAVDSHPLVAAMRVLVIYYIGEQVDIPDTLFPNRVKP